MTEAHPEFSKAAIEAAQIYADMMGEIKRRVDLLQKTLSDAPEPTWRTLEEFSYLQLRMICELIAVACLVSHGDVKGARTNDLRKTTKADLIIFKLTGLHKRFYPIPEVMRVDQDGKWQGGAILIDGFLTKADLLSLYRTCGNRLHRGSLSSILKEFAAPKTYVFDRHEVFAPLTKIIMLLRNHTIVMIDPAFRLHVAMDDGSGARPTVRLMHVQGGEPLCPEPLGDLPRDHPLFGN
jgi:hypothetical protein